MSKKSKKKADQPRRYRVTQPAHQGAGTADYPEYTTRVASNSRYILAANHPHWYELLAEHEPHLLAVLNRERLAKEFPMALESTAAVTPLHAYGLVLLQLMGDYVEQNIGNDPRVTSVFSSAVGTVISNLSKLIFRDPQTLRGSYTAADLARWQASFEAYMTQDLFVYRPGDEGVDTDGKTKPILELCPVPELGRHLVKCGFQILYEYVAGRTFLTPPGPR